MKLLPAAFLPALVLCIGLCACGNPAGSTEPSEITAPPVIAPEKRNIEAEAETAAPVQELPAESLVPEEPEPPEPQAPEEGDLGDYHLKLLSAEGFTAYDGSAGIRFYYDFSNNSDHPASAVFSLILSARQSGQELTGTFALQEVPEYSYASLEVMPGLTIRCVAEYACDPAGGPVSFTASVQGAGSLSAEFNPAALPGPPAEDFSIAPIPDPDWLEDLSGSGSLGPGLQVSILRGETVQDQAGSPMLRIYYELTNTGDSPQTFFGGVRATVMQDGVGLEPVITGGQVPEDANDMVAVEPGETITVARCYLLRTGSPVTAVITDSAHQDTLGAVIPVE